MINIAILGAGKIARAMAKTVNGMMAAGDESVALYAVSSRDQAKADDFAAEFDIAHAYGSYQSMLADPDVDLVYVATPHSHHAQHMKMCIAAGKHVLCEKAFTINAAQAREVLALAKRKRVLVAEAIWTRYMPSRTILADLIAGGSIGTPHMLTASLGYTIASVPRIREPELAGGALLDVGVYPLNFASMMFGNDISSVDSTVQLMDTGVDEQESITYTYADGSMAILMASALFNSDRRCCIYGDKGCITVDNVNNPLHVEVFDNSRSGVPVRVIDMPKQITGYEYEVQACVRAIEAEALECPEMPHSEIIRMMEQMDALRDAWGLRYPME